MNRRTFFKAAPAIAVAPLALVVVKPSGATIFYTQRISPPPVTSVRRIAISDGRSQMATVVGRETIYRSPANRMLYTDANGVTHDLGPCQ